jgi:tyrosinase
MSRFNTAALDPIFWVHHANIDRLWEVWLRRDPTHKNPTEALWRSGIAFDFRNAAGAEVQMTCGEVVDPTAAPLDYTYDDLADPLVAAPLAEPPATISTTEDDVVPEPELLATSDMSVKLGTGVSRVVIATRARCDAIDSWPSRRFEEGPIEP